MLDAEQIDTATLTLRLGLLLHLQALPPLARIYVTICIQRKNHATMLQNPNCEYAHTNPHNMSLDTERTCRVTVQYAPCQSSSRQYLVVPSYRTYQRAAYHLQSDLQDFGHREEYIHTQLTGVSLRLLIELNEAVEIMRCDNLDKPLCTT
jgi:hypothetical protein